MPRRLLRLRIELVIFGIDTIKPQLPIIPVVIVKPKVKSETQLALIKNNSPFHRWSIIPNKAPPINIKFNQFLCGTSCLIFLFLTYSIIEATVGII